MAVLEKCSIPGCTNQTFVAMNDTAPPVCDECRKKEQEKEEKKEQERWDTLTSEEKIEDLNQRLREIENRPPQLHFPLMDG